MALSEAEERRLQEDVKLLRHHLFGNGREGLDEIVRRNTAELAAIRTGAATTNAKIDRLTSSVDALRQERRDDQSRREGAVSALGWLKWSLAVLALLITIGGGLGLYRVSSQNQTVLEVLQKLPTLPE